MIPDGGAGVPVGTRAARAAREAVPLAVAALAAFRGAGLPMTSDIAFHLIRAGNSLLRGSLDGWSLPPGGVHAPLLGSLAVAFAALFTGDPEGKILVSGCAVLALTAWWLVRTLMRERDITAALLAAAFLLLPSGLAASFNHRPDAALGGLLLAVAWNRARRGEAAPLALAPAWLAVLTTPWALPAALGLHFAPGLRRRRSVVAFLPVAAVAGVVVVLSASLVPGRHLEILRGIFGEVRPGAAGLRSSVAALRLVWGGGLLLAPLALAFAKTETRLPARFLGPFAGALAAAFLLGGPGAFLGATAVFAPAAALVFALVASRFPDRPGAERRPLAVALLLPLLVMLLGGGTTAQRQLELRASAVRDAQLGTLFWEQKDLPGSIAAERTGALAAMSGRIVHVLRRDGSLPQPLPRWFVFAEGLLPTTPRERTQFDEPGFLAAYAPREVRRGESNLIADVVWTLREPPSERPPAGYPPALRRAWEARAAGDTARCAARLEEAVRLEPSDLGLARESLGLLREHEGDADASAALLEEARRRDPVAILARAHLADRAISRGEIPRADSLLTEAFRVQRDSGPLRGVRVRLFAAAGYPAEAERESAAAIFADPTEGRLLVNHGILLWRRGATGEARELWTRAVHLDPAQRRYLGRFEAAADTLSPPPLQPIFSAVDFHPPSPAGAHPDTTAAPPPDPATGSRGMR